MKTDTLFYRLFQRLPNVVLELLNLDYRSESYRFGSEEIKQTAFRLDGIYTPVAGDAGQPLIFVEVQYQPDSDFYDRFFSEITLYLRLHKPAHPWLALVIYPSRGTEKAASTAFSPFMDLPQLRRVYLEDYRDCQGLSPTLELVRLIASQEPQTLTLARALAGRRDELGPDGLDFIETILVYKLPRLSREEIKTMLALNEIELKQTRFYQEVVEEGRQEGEKKGRQEGERKGRQEGERKGRQEGEKKGRQIGEQILLQRILTRRFGALPDWAQDRLLQASPGQLEQWADRLLEASTLDSVFNG
jgi:predicted transposase/invertase (TIGR01784 family)